MLKSQLEPSSQNYETTSMFVENIFDTVKKAKAAKAAKSLAESKLMTPYQYSFADLSPGKKKKPRKNAKKNGKIKKSPAPKKKMNLRKPKTLKEGTEKRKKTTPTKSPRKYTKRITKVPAPTDIDDEEAAFILSSISQRSFDSFYNRLNSSETNTIHIPLDSPSFSVQTLSSSTPSNSSHHQDQAYYVMLDHNYWIEPKVITKTETVDSETFLNNSIMKPTETQPEEQNTTNRSASESTQSVSETTRSISESTQSVSESNRSVSESNDFNSPADSKINEVNNNKLQTSPPGNEIFEQEPSIKEHNTAVKKRWLRQAATEMKTPPKKRKTLEILPADVKQENENENLIEMNDKIEKIEKIDKIDKIEKIDKVEKVDKIQEVKAVEDKNVRVEEELKVKVEESPIQDLIIETKLEVPLKPCEELKEEHHEEQPQMLEPKVEILPEVHTSPEILPETLSADKPAMSPIRIEAVVVAENHANSDVEEDDMQWEKVMDFHKLQLEKLTKANKRFTEDHKQENDALNPFIKSVEQKRKNFIPVKSLYKRETSVQQQIGFDFNPAIRSRFNLLLDTPNMAETCRANTDMDKYSHQRSFGEFSPTNTRKSRWGSSTVVSFVTNSSQPFTTFSENNYPRSEPYSKTNYSNYRAQKDLCMNGQSVDVEEPSWALYETQFNKLTKESFQVCSRDSSFESKKLSDCTLENLNIIPKKSFTAYDALTKTKTAVADPRLNPSLLQEKKDDALTPKKKVSKALTL